MVLTAYDKLVQLGDICRVPDTIVIKAYVRNHTDKTINIYWRDHGNGLRSIHFSRPLSPEDAIASSRGTALILTNYRFTETFKANCILAADVDESQLYNMLYTPEYDILYIESTASFDGRSPPLRIVLPSEALPRPVAYTGEPRIPQVHNS